VKPGEQLREEFVRLLTEDSQTNDRRRKEFNQAIFASEAEGGWAIFNGTDVSMVLAKFDKLIPHIDTHVRASDPRRHQGEGQRWMTSARLMTNTSRGASHVTPHQATPTS
jgi:hypothetical protein